MEPWSAARQSWARIALHWLLCSVFVLRAQALYFYVDGGKPKCFYEEMPKDTLVVGHFEAEQYSESAKAYVPDSAVRVYISVEEVFDNYHRIVSQSSEAKGRFMFSAADSGEHRLCFTPMGAGGHHGVLSSGEQAGGVRLDLDIVIGETSQIESTDKGSMEDVIQKVKDLNMKLGDIRREQVFQREREAEFRDQAESTNARVVRWSLIQLAVLGVTCAWQLSHLRAFFIKQKLT